MARNRKETSPPISRGGVYREPSLQWPFVEYPNTYGTFFRFSQSEDGIFHFCKCAESALRNLVRINQRFPPYMNSDKRRMGLLDNGHVPNRVAEETFHWREFNDADVRFEPNLCHRCTKVPPTLRFCHEMYGDQWRQTYGWYSNLASLEGGVDPRWPSKFLENLCPAEIIPYIQDYSTAQSEIMQLAMERRGQYGYDPRQEPLRKRMEKAQRRITRHFTSNAREAFGFKRVGDGWVSETLLFSIVQELMPHTSIIRHYRPEWLEGLELDIYIPAFNVGIEYQGAQHVSSMAHWGGESALVRQRERDMKKKRLCSSYSCKLIEIWYTESLSRPTIRQALLKGGLSPDMLVEA